MTDDCHACNLTAGKTPLIGGRIFETAGWVVEHCVGPLGIGTLIVKPKRHVLHVWALSRDELAEMGPLLGQAAQVVKSLTECDQAYVCLWSHGGFEPVHIHFVVQPITGDDSNSFDRAGPALQLAMFDRNELPNEAGVIEFCARARAAFTRVVAYDKPDIARRIREVSRLEGSFTLRSGRQADTYFDKYLFESDPALLDAIVGCMQALVPAGTEVLCGLELGGIPIVTLLSHRCQLPAAFIRKSPKEHGTCKYAEGPPLADKNVLIVEDVVSSGGAILNNVKVLREDGISVERALCVIDRRPEGADALEAAGITLTSVFTMDEIELA